MKAFVAGGTGVLGRRVVAQPRRRRPWCPRHGVHGRRRDAPAGARAVPVDVNLDDPTALRAAISGQDVVLRLTTKIPSLMKMRSAAPWQETGRLRTAGAQALVEACLAAGVGTYVHESVAFVYADGGDGWLTEDSPVDVLEPGSILHQAVDGEAHARAFTAPRRQGARPSVRGVLRGRLGAEPRDGLLGAARVAGAGRPEPLVVFLDCARRCRLGDGGRASRAGRALQRRRRRAVAPGRLHHGARRGRRRETAAPAAPGLPRPARLRRDLCSPTRAQKVSAARLHQGDRPDAGRQERARRLAADRRGLGGLSAGRVSR